METKIRPATIATFGLFALVGITIIFGSWYTVDQGERVVVTQNGAVVEDVGPGLHFKTPWIQSITTFDIRTQKSDSVKSSVYSKDIQSAELVMSVNFRIDPSKVKDIYATLGENYFQRIVSPNILRITKETTGRFNAAEIVQTRDKLATQITDNLSEALKGTGIIIEQVQVENVDFDDGFEHAIADRMKAEVAVQQQKQILEQQRVQADKVKIDADASAYQVKTAADAESYRITALAQATANSIQKQGEALRTSPQFVEYTKAQKWDGKLPTTMLPNGATPLIDLRSGQ
jgi:regulator of protease activity HflC (stomatin/prohibitin superfamily)